MRFLMTVLLSVMMASTAAFAGEIKIERASALEMPEGLPTAGVFMIVTNSGEADKLLSAKTDVAEQTMLHTMDVDPKTGALVMKHVESFEVPADGSLALAPGSNHIMLMGMKRQFKKDETFPMTLVFEKAGEKKVDVEIIPTSKMSDRFPPELSSDVIDKAVAIQKKLGQEVEKKSGWDTLRQKIQNLFRKEKAGETEEKQVPSRTEMEERMKMDAMSHGDAAHADHGNPVTAPASDVPATDASAPKAPIATDPVDPAAGPLLEPQKAVIPPAPAPAPSSTTVPSAPAPAPNAAPKP